MTRPKLSPRHLASPNSDPSLAARSDPWTLDRQLADQIAEHERVLARRPADTHEALAAARTELAPAEALLANMDAVAAYSASQLDSYGTLAGLSRRGRQERRDLQDKLTVERQQARDAKDRRDEIVGRVAALRRDTDDLERFERA